MGHYDLPHVCWMMLPSSILSLYWSSSSLRYFPYFLLFFVPYLLIYSLALWTSMNLERHYDRCPFFSTSIWLLLQFLHSDPS
jgi:hypothetical protein